MKGWNLKEPIYKMVSWFFDKLHLDALSVAPVIVIVCLIILLKNYKKFMKGSISTKINWYAGVFALFMVLVLFAWIWTTKWGLIR